ncbi:DUF3291 domain-containing protein [Muriicola marianensis]|uniref:DUF3291 domain-containing protein n=1 Tax=Muriicola marianensis TaxID=1324801 RepID=A0ABQ1QTZ2_9FLAO|nr:DUF3291 domain-containing protein [Muriicola marianensis]GGD42032.1 hypothetical protein GCM10011361_06340 [Muriicola marianensis]
MADYFAQINIARAKYPLDDTRMSDFVDNIPGINALADGSPGFVWRWIEEPESGVQEVFGDRALVVNMSVWESRDALMNFTYRTGHAEIFRRRNEWFSKLEDSHMACWYTRIPKISLAEAKKRLDHLNAIGETPYSFTLRTDCTPQEAAAFLEANPSLL